MTRYTPLIKLGEAQAWLATEWRRAESTTLRSLLLTLWLPLRALFLLGYWIQVPNDARR